MISISQKTNPLRILSSEDNSRIRNIKFGCDFQSGQCRLKRSHPKYKSYVGAVCCNNCARMNGYLGVPVSEMPPEYQDLFDDKLGFYRPNHGCVLEIDQRSSKCNLFVCEVCVVSDGDKEIIQDIEART